MIVCVSNKHMERNTQQIIESFLEKETGHAIADARANLIETGAVDSFSMIKLIAFIEERFNVAIDMEELSPENFYSLESMAAFIKRLVDKNK